LYFISSYRFGYGKLKSLNFPLEWGSFWTWMVRPWVMNNFEKIITRKLYKLVLSPRLVSRLGGSWSWVKNRACDTPLHTVFWMSERHWEGIVYRKK
jgi:hypothetical protein